MPQVLGSGFPETMSEGMELRGKNQTRIPVCWVHSVAYTPPESVLKPVPYEAVEKDDILHPVSSRSVQSVEVRLEEMMTWEFVQEPVAFV